jgi:predicted AAA+ superfamily ATPase
MKVKDVSVLVEYFGEHPIVKIIDFLIENKLFDYSKKQIMEEAGISKATLFKYFAKLEEAGIVKVSRKFGKTKLYKISTESPIVKRVIDLGLALANEASRKIVEKELTIHARH